MIVLIVHMTVKAETEEECKRLMRDMAEETRKEPGCLQYAVHQSTDDSQNFAFYEQYADQAALDAHRASAHYAWYIKGGVDALITARTIEMFVPLA